MGSKLVKDVFSSNCTSLILSRLLLLKFRNYVLAFSKMEFFSLEI